VCRDSVARVFRIPTDGSGKSHIYQSRSYSVIRPRGLAVSRGGPAGLAGVFGDVNPHCCRTGNLGPPLPERVAGSLRLPPDAHPAARAVTHPDVGALFQPGTVIAVCVRPAVPPPMPRPDARNLPSRTAPALIADSASGKRVGGGLAAILPRGTPSIMTAGAKAQGRVSRPVIPSVEPPCFHHPQGVPRKPCSSPWLTKSHGQLTWCPPLQPSAVVILTDLRQISPRTVLGNLMALFIGEA